MTGHEPWFPHPPHRGPFPVWLAAPPGWPRRPGPPPPPGGFPPGWFHGGWPPFRPNPRVRAGDVRAAILALLAEGPRNGYQIIQEIAQRSRGVWRPSPGSVYPALQQLEDEGLIRAEESEGRRLFHLTEAGGGYVEEHRDELIAPWEAVTETLHERVPELMAEAGQLGAALMQVGHAGTDAQVAEARQIVARARRALYRLLADEPEKEG